MKALGRTMWAIPGGHIPLKSTGHEPEWTSYNKIYMLNMSDKEAHVKIIIFYADREPVGPYELTVAARRVRSVRFNDLINPEAIPLDTDYASIIESDTPIIVQFTKQDTSRVKNATATTMAFPVDTQQTGQL